MSRSRNILEIEDCLKSFATSELVAELCKREGVTIGNCENWYVPYKSIILVVRE